MSARYPARVALRTVPELILLALIVAAVVNIIRSLIVDGYLPQPFIWDTNDTFMDWFNTAFWAHNSGAYSVWRTVYPPLSFAFLKLFSTPVCYVNDVFVGRNCDTFSIVSILSFYAAGMIAAGVVFHRRDPATGWIRTAALALSYPGLFVLERGNLIIPCFLFFVVAHGDLVRAGWLRAVAGAVTINFKPYLLIPILGHAIKRDWRALEKAGIATIAVYLISYGVVGGGSPMEIVDNTANWITFTSGSFIGEVYQTTSYNALFGVIEHGFPILKFTDSGAVEFWLRAIRVFMTTIQLIAVLAIAGAWLQPKALTLTRASLLLLTLSLTNQSPGGYTEVFVLFLLFLEPWRRPGQVAAIVCGYVIAIPYDYVFAQLPNIWSDSWLTGRAIVGYFGIAYGQFLRPAVLLLMLLFLSLDTLGRVWRAHRTERPLLWLRRPVAA